MFKCEFCSAVFKARNLLTRHLKEAKYCAKIRSSKTVCEVCNKAIQPDVYYPHVLVCLRKQNETLREEISESKIREESQNERFRLLEEAFTEALKTSKKTVKKTINKTVNNTVNVSLTVNEVWLKSQGKFLTADHVVEGSKGVFDYGKKALYSRVVGNKEEKLLKYRNETGELILDKEGKKLIRIFLSSITNPTITLHKSIISETRKSLEKATTEEERWDFDEKISRVSRTKNQIINGGNGEENFLVKDLSVMFVDFFSSTKVDQELIDQEDM